MTTESSFQTFPIHLFVNPLKMNVPHHMETSQLIGSTNQLTGLYMMWNIGSLTTNDQEAYRERRLKKGIALWRFWHKYDELRRNNSLLYWSEFFSIISFKENIVFVKLFEVVYVIEVTGKISNLFIFFLQKDFKRTKALTSKEPTNKTKISEQKNNKGNNFLRAQTPKGVKVACFAFGAFFYA